MAPMEPKSRAGCKAMPCSQGPSSTCRQFCALFSCGAPPSQSIVMTRAWANCATAMSSEPAYVDSFIRYSDRSAEGGCIKANGDYSFDIEDHPRRIYNA